MKKPIVGVVFALTILATAIALRGGKEDAARDVAKSVTTGMTARTSTDAVLSIAPSARPAVTPKAPSTAVTPLMREFTESRSDQAIYKRLMGQVTWTPEEEWVLARILDRCADVTDRKDGTRVKSQMSLGADKSRERFVASLSPRAPNRDKRIAAFDTINFDMCAGMDAVKTKETDIRAMYEHAASRGDPKARVEVLRMQLDDQRRDASGQMDWTRPVLISDAQLESWKDVFTSADPRAIIDAVELLGNNAFSMHVRGPDEAPVDYNAFQMAAWLTACELGRDCGPDSTYLRQSCALNGACDAADMRDLILFYGLTPSGSQLAIQYQARLMDVVRTGSWSYFTIVRGPSPSVAPFVGR